MEKNIIYDRISTSTDSGLESFQEKMAASKTVLRNLDFRPPNLPFPLGVHKQFELYLQTPAGFYRRIFSRRVKVLSHDQVHKSSREPAILTGYRPDVCNLSEALASLVSHTNETLNFWSHFLAASYFIWRFTCLAEVYNFRNDVYVWPLIPYFFTAFLYPFMSSIAHAFSCLGFAVRHICFFLDYGAISIYSFGCAVAYRAYLFPANLFHSTFEQQFLYIASANSLVATVLTCLSRFVPDEKRALQKTLRLGWFVVSYLWDSIPLIGRITTCSVNEMSKKSILMGESPCDMSATYHYLQMAAIGIAAFCYATHIPEKLYPGKFDYFGNSHHFLHVFGVLATYFQMEGILIDVEHRREFLSGNDVLLTEFSSLILPLGVIFSNFLVLFAFSIYVLKKYSNEVSSIEKKQS